jgi:RNA polymerase sigma-70 factor (ECF subfamily)
MTLPERQDPERLERCRRGDRAAMGDVLRAELGYLQRFVARLAGPRADVDDVVQTVLERAVESFPRFRGEASVRTWLARIATHVLLDRLRRGRVRKEHAHLVLVHDAGEEHAPPDRRLDARRRLERLYVHFDALPPKNRLAFQLHVIDGRPVPEVAALMASSRVTTRSRVFLARRALLARVKDDPALADLFEAWEGGP